MAVAKMALTKMFSMSREVVSANFLSNYVEYQFAKKLPLSTGSDVFVRAVAYALGCDLYHDPSPYEFTLQMFRSPSVEKAVMEEYVQTLNKPKALLKRARSMIGNTTST